MGGGLLAYSGYTFWQKKNRKENSQTIVLQSLITCPKCGFSKNETMPTDACQFFYECENCHAVLKPLAGDCCAFCSYGSVQCPPIQAGEKKCC
ncbi:MAG TPA: GDCCVxC domain-containing (seleno)protein [Saprospiraceae bacterium]|nr:GDCCVxC domain-containing (seleno)protein [Saprospiraceae bacterium]